MAYSVDDLYLAAICAVVPGLGRRNLLRLSTILGGMRAVFEADAKTLSGTKLVTEAAVNNFVSHRRDTLPAEIDYFCRQEGVQLCTILQDAYPGLLHEIHDRPLVLYVKGELALNDYPVAIVGSRAATPYGIRAAEYFANTLARKGITIVSGGARGIDAAAHEAALKAGGRTIAVLGSGLDNPYPATNISLFQRIAQHGAVISEFAPGMPPLAQNFPMRNRVIVGLSRAVLVAEAAKRSGAIITANIAADENREVFCVPGSIFERTSIGCHDLIRTGAHLLDSPQDVFEEIAAWRLSMAVRVEQPSIFSFVEDEPQEETMVQNKTSISQPEEKQADAKAAGNTEAKQANNLENKNDTPMAEDHQKNNDNNHNETISELGRKILQLLRGNPLSLEQLVVQTGASFPQISVELLELQVAGMVAVDQGQRYYC